MPVSEAQLAANQANAQKSTGPRTPEGKNVSRLNGVRHRVTQQVMIMPEPQMEAYLEFHKAQQEAHAPANPIEKQLVQTIIDTQWRMNCGRAWELSLFADNHEKFADLIVTERPEVQAAMTAIRTLTNKANELKLLSLYEQRINRTLQTAFKQLKEMQEERKQREKTEMKEANLIAKLFQMKGEVYNPADDGFAFSTKRFGLYQTREQHLHEARIAERVHYNVASFQAAVARE
jgi:hypothetical protein